MSYDKWCFQIGRTITLAQNILLTHLVERGNLVEPYIIGVVNRRARPGAAVHGNRFAGTYP